MAILRGTFDGNVIPDHLILDSAGVDTFLVVSNNGPGSIGVEISLGPPVIIQYANSQAFFLPSGTRVSIHGPSCTASWELAVPG